VNTPLALPIKHVFLAYLNNHHIKFSIPLSETLRDIIKINDMLKTVSYYFCYLYYMNYKPLIQNVFTVVIKKLKNKIYSVKKKE